ncbi:MAG: stage 0 sporulation family protein [Bacillota bacterium]|jgi:cell fate regulator YaaT (PSP1 superfamily)|nr:stage 0 sporulation family protein [Bacillota bacterium]NLJ02077.1 stage 0 sporulation family protein [Bacillota bacterium]
MVTIVGVRFKKAGKIYYFSPGELQIAAGDGCIVETARGVEFGHVVIPPRQVPESEVVQPLKQVLRSANAEDYARMEANRRRAEEAFGIAVEKVKEHQLPMRMLEAEYTLDDSKLIFSFSAEGRVDFRELVKDLAAIFRTRIELRQVGVRDEAKILGGLGSCGRSLCCATFLGEFEPVSIRMAKEQNLSLNPSKISGVCGRLMCCLKYECEVYEDSREVFGTCCKDTPRLVDVDEFYHEVEEESDYYLDLLKEDSIQEVDYQMMVETAEIEKNTIEDTREQSKNRPAKKKRKPKKKKKEGAKQEREQSAKPAGESAAKKRRRPRRRKAKPKAESKGE